MELPATSKAASSEENRETQAVSPAPIAAANEFPNAALLGVAVLAWTALFHWLGISTLGYGSSNSIFDWLRSFYSYAWIKDTDDQICFVAPFAIFLIFKTRAEEILKAPRYFSPTALLIVAGAVLLHVSGYVLQQARLSVAAYIFGVYGIMGIFWGWRWLKAIAFPYFLLLFCVPISSYLDSFTFRLRLISTAVSVAIAKVVLNLPVTRSGTMVFHPATATFPAFQFEVAAACSGIRSMAVVLLLTVACSFLFLRSWWTRLIVIAASPFLALAGNIVRLVIAFLAGDIGGQAAAKAVENKAGFVTFTVAFAAIGLLIKWLPDTASSEAPTDPIEPAPRLRSRGAAPYLCLAAVLGLAATAAWSLDRIKATIRLGEPGVRITDEPVRDETGAIAKTNSVYLPPSLPGLTSESASFTAIEYGYLPADTTFGKRIYKSGDGQFQAAASVVLMGTDRISIHKPDYCLTGAGWHILSNATTVISLAGGGQLQANRFDMAHAIGDDASSHVSGIYVFWFVADGVRTASHSVREWSMIQSVLTGKPMPRWAYIAFFTPCMPGEEEKAFEKLTQVIRLAQPEIERGQLKAI